MIDRSKLPPPPELSPNFTLEDIRKIRDWHYECSKLMTEDEYAAFISEKARNFDATMAERSKKEIQK